MNVFQTIIQYRDLLSNLVARDLKTRYRGSMLGFLWTVLTPLFMALIYIFFLRLLAGRGVGVRHEEIIIGVFAWQFTMQCVNAGVHCITGNTVLVKKVFFPRIILPLSVCVANLVNFLLTVVVQWGLLIVLLRMKGEMLPLATAAVPVVCLYHALFNLALVLVVAAANVYFRDTQHIVNLLMNAWFFMSPVMYPLSFVKSAAAHWPWLPDVYLLNPVAGLLTLYRWLQLPGAQFPWSAASIVGLLWPVGFLIVAYGLFQRAQRNFSDVL